MDVMRFTAIDARGAISFLSAPSVLPALVAACSTDPDTVEGLLVAADRFAAEVSEYVHSGLAIFDEHNVPGHYESIHAALDLCPPAEVPVFRVVDDRTRETSLTPIRAGVVLFNLVAKRIVQIQNTAVRIDRSGRFRVRRDGDGGSMIIRYRLPESWHLVP